MNGRLDSIQCAIVTEKLAIFGDELERRNELAALYNSGFSDTGNKRESGWGYYTVAIDDRDGDAGAPERSMHPQPLHAMKAFEVRPDGMQFAREQRTRLPLPAGIRISRTPRPAMSATGSSRRWNGATTRRRRLLQDPIVSTTKAPAGSETVVHHGPVEQLGPQAHGQGQARASAGDQSQQQGRRRSSCL